MALGEALWHGWLVALGGGLLVGIERERNAAEHQRRAMAGVRTHAIAALTGVVAAHAGEWALAVTGLAVTALAWASYLRADGGAVGLTSELALVFTWLLGAVAAGQPQTAAALFVATTIVLASKEWLHRFTLQVLTQNELADLLLLAGSALIVLPLLPDRALDPFGVLNPRSLWLLVVLVMTINAAGYVALRALGARHGLILAGLLGGIVSATATIGGMGQRARQMPAILRQATAAGVISHLATLGKIVAVLAALSPALLPRLVPGLAGATLMILVFAFAYGWRASPGTGDDADATSPRRPFDLRHALAFALVVTVALLTSALLHRWFGAGGAIAGSAAAGLAGIYPASISVAQLSANAGLPANEATLALAAALIANTTLKCVLAWVAGGRRYGRPLTAALLLADGAFLGGLLLAWQAVPAQ